MVPPVCSHSLYLILAAFSAAFLRTPPFTRLFLLLIIPLNAVAEIRGKSSLDFTLMTLFILLSATANLTCGLALRLFSPSAAAKSDSPADAREKTDSAASSSALDAITAALSDQWAQLPLRRASASSSSRRHSKSRSRSRSRSGSRLRRRVRRISSSEDDDPLDPEASVDPTFLPEEDSLSESGRLSRLSSTLITNSAHLTAKFGEAGGTTEPTEERQAVPSLGMLAPRSVSLGQSVPVDHPGRLRAHTTEPNTGVQGAEKFFRIF